MAVAAGLGGCGKSRNKDGLAQRLKSEAKQKLDEDSAPLIVKGTDNDFTVQDAKGKMILTAKVEHVQGAVATGAGLQGPVNMIKAKCRLFQEGKPHMDMVTDAATWDGKQLITQAPAHGVATDGTSILDAHRATWTAETGHMAMQQGKMQSLKNGKTEFTAQGARVEVQDRVVNIASQARGWNPDGQQLTSDRARWWMDSGKLEADGNVVVTDESTRVTGRHLRSNTKLKKGRLTGGTRAVIKKTPKAGKNRRNAKSRI